MEGLPCFLPAFAGVFHRAINFRSTNVRKRLSKRKFFMPLMFFLIFISIYCLFVIFLAVYENKVLAKRDKWISHSQKLEPILKIKPNSVILLHGFVGSPFDMKGLAEHLHGMGFRVLVPLLEGQTYLTPIYKRGNFSTDFYIKKIGAIIENEIKLTGKKPYLVGFSMGGTLSTILAQKYALDKLVLIAPFYKLPRIGDWIWSVSNILSHVLPYIPKFSKGKINSENGYDNYYPGSYIISLKAFDVLGKTVIEARKDISHLKADTLICMSINDQVASSKEILYLFNKKGNVEIIREDESNHILLYDFNSEDIITHITRFLLK